MEPGGAARSRSLGSLYRKIKSQILGHPNPETKGEKNIFGEYFETYIQKHVSSHSDHFCIGVKITSKNIFLPMVSGLKFPQILGFGFSVRIGETKQEILTRADPIWNVKRTKRERQAQFLWPAQWARQSPREVV